MLDSLSCSFTH